MNESLKKILRSAVMLGAFSVVGMGMVSITHRMTEPRIAANEREALLRNLSALIPADVYDNDLLVDTIEVNAPALNPDGQATVHRARKAGEAVAAVMTVTAPDGYSGNIKMLVGIYADGTLAGVRVISHRETPGLGDRVEEARSAWIYGFQGRSLENPGEAGWAVKRDGGAFDQFTGATITPRATVNAVHRTLVYFRDNREKILADAP